jgi:Sec-independent protein translocase protein TatA
MPGSASTKQPNDTGALRVAGALIRVFKQDLTQMAFTMKEATRKKNKRLQAKLFRVYYKVRSGKDKPGEVQAVLREAREFFREVKRELNPAKRQPRVARRDTTTASASKSNRRSKKTAQRRRP